MLYNFFLRLVTVQIISCMNFNANDGIITPSSLETLQSELKNSDLPVILLLYAPWCGHCVRSKPEFSLLAREASGLIRVFAVDAHECAEVAKFYKVKGFPTIIRYDSGSKASWTYYQGKREAHAMIQSVMRKIQWNVRSLRNNSDIHEFFLSDRNVTQGLLLFTEKIECPSIFKLVSAKLHPSIRCFTINKVWRQKLDIIEKSVPEKYPSIYLMRKNGPNEASLIHFSQMYSGKFTVQNIIKFASEVPGSKNMTVSTKEQFPIFNEESLGKLCVEHYCVLPIAKNEDNSSMNLILERVSSNFASDRLIFFHQTSHEAFLRYLPMIDLDGESVSVIIFKKTASGIKYHVEVLEGLTENSENRMNKLFENFLTGNIHLARA